MCVKSTPSDETDGRRGEHRTPPRCSTPQRRGEDRGRAGPSVRTAAAPLRSAPADSHTHTHMVQRSNLSKLAFLCSGCVVTKHFSNKNNSNSTNDTRGSQGQHSGRHGGRSRALHACKNPRVKKTTFFSQSHDHFQRKRIGFPTLALSVAFASSDFPQKNTKLHVRWNITIPHHDHGPHVVSSVSDAGERDSPLRLRLCLLPPPLHCTALRARSVSVVKWHFSHASRHLARSVSSLLRCTALHCAHAQCQLSNGISLTRHDTSLARSATRRD